MNAAGISDRGRVREKNEDRFLLHLKEPLQLFAVADGMGGHAAGEVASTLALDTIHRYLAEEGSRLLEASIPQRLLPSFIEDMLSLANSTVLEASQANAEYAGMGTTLTLILGIHNEFWLGHIGDSRAYLINKNDIFHLTEDHTLASQLARTGQSGEEEQNGRLQRHILTRALGTDEEAVFDILPLSVADGDAILLCSDGLYGLVEDNEIKKSVLEGNNPQTVLEILVALANERGGTDNITAILAYFQHHC